LIESLNFPREDARLRNVKRAHGKTCLWIFSQAEFKQWRDARNVAEHHGFLWIKGKPGSGKSTIMKAYDVRKKKANEVVIAYFFNARATDVLEKSSLGMYRSLVRQLLRALPHLEDAFLEQFHTKANKGDADPWTSTELQEFILQVAESLGHRSLTVFIDALDEGQEDDIRSMIQFLEELGQVSVDSQVSLRICLSSRHYPCIRIKKGIDLVVDSQPGHNNDIASYVNDHLKIDDSTQTEALKQKICAKASGVFLWIVLVIPILNKQADHGHIDAMNKCLDDIPPELDDLFARILERDTENRGEVLRSLQWALYAQRPLSPVELYLAIKAGSESPDELTSEIPHEEAIRRYLLSCSKGLTEVSSSEPPIIQFIHETVRSFLLKENGLTDLQSDLGQSSPGRSHQQLRQNCFRYLLLVDGLPQFDEVSLGKRKRNATSEGKQMDENVKDDISREFPFTEYAVKNVFLHAEAAQSHGLSQRAFLKHLAGEANAAFRKWILLYNIFQRYRIRRYTPRASLLYITSDHNLINLVK
ncbi:hypothetical protein EV356DRAFT_429177, partial [Viridothelium virens]